MVRRIIDKRGSMVRVTVRGMERVARLYGVSAVFERIMGSRELAAEFLSFCLDLKKNGAGPYEGPWHGDIDWEYWTRRAGAWECMMAWAS